MKKIFCAALALLLCAAALAGCQKTPQADVSMFDLFSSLQTALNTDAPMVYVSAADDGAEEKFAYLSDMDYGLVSNFGLLYAENGAGNADELAVIEVKNENDVKKAEESLKAHVEKRATLYATYDPTQTQKLGEAQIFTAGRLAVLLVCDSPADVKAALQAFLQSAQAPEQTG